jgi:hypothetical protein
MTENRNKIVERIKLLFNLGKSPNENEAASAIAMAKKLMDEHKISQIEIDKTKTNGLDEKHTDLTVIQIEHSLIISLLIKHFHVRIYTLKRQNRVKQYVSFIGQKDDVDIAYYMFQLLVKIFRNLWNKREKKNVKLERNSYMIGLAEGIGDLLTKQSKEQSKEHQNALIVIENELTKIADDYWIEKNMPPIREKPNPIQLVNIDAYCDGYLDGALSKLFETIQQKREVIK